MGAGKSPTVDGTHAQFMLRNLNFGGLTFLIADGADNFRKDSAFVAALQDFDLMSQELDHVSSLLAAIGESLQHRDAVEVAVDHGIDAVKLSSMRTRLKAAVYDEVPSAAVLDDQDEIW